MECHVRTVLSETSRWLLGLGRLRRRPPWVLVPRPILVLLVVGAVGAPFASAVKNEFLPITVLCQDTHKSFLSNIPRPIDGAVIVSHNERDVDCVVTFQTESILERFMLRFEELEIDCNDHLYVFDGAHAIGNHKASISCDKTASTVGSDGTIFTRTNYVTLKYVTDSWGTERNGFRLVITAFKDAEQNGCRNGFQCGTQICIDRDLVCDTVNHCGDGEDERASQFCTPLGFPTWLGMDLSTMVAIALAGVLLILAGAVTLWIWSCRKRRDQRAAAQASMAAAYQMPSAAKGMNGVSHTNHTTEYNNRDHDGFQQIYSDGFDQPMATTLVMESGNAILPAVGRGYKSFYQTLRTFWRVL